MRMAVILFLISFPIVSFAADKAQFGSSHYDYRTGNTYNVQPQLGGGYNVQGYNPQTGSQWNTQINNNGNMNGRDAGGNNWNYNSNTNTYQNYGTGEVRRYK